MASAETRLTFRQHMRVTTLRLHNQCRIDNILKSREMWKFSIYFSYIEENLRISRYVPALILCLILRHRGTVIIGSIPTQGNKLFSFLRFRDKTSCGVHFILYHGVTLNTKFEQLQINVINLVYHKQYNPQLILM